jgi:hypothetical protein
MANIGDIYSLAHARMLNSVRGEQGAVHAADSNNSTTPTTKYVDGSEYGPYHAQYWSMMGGNLDTGVPVPSNGGYQSPYATTAPEVFFPAVTVHSPTETYAEMGQNNGYDHPDGSVYSLGRNTQFIPQPVSPNVYPSPVDNFSWNYFPSMDSHTQNLTTLDNLGSQMLNTMLTNSSEDFVAMLSHNDTVFANVESTFYSVSKQLPHDASNRFLDMEQLRSTAPTQLSSVHKANLAIFATSVFRGRDVPFMDLNAAFLDIFMPAGTRLLQNEGALFLELKTQAFMALAMNHAYPREHLERLFPRDLQLTLLRRGTGSHHLAATEQDFISRYNSRRQHLSLCCDDIEALNQLPSRYSWTDLLNELRTCVSRSLDYIDRTKAATTPSATGSTNDDPITKAALAAHAAISGGAQHQLSPHPYAPSLLNTTGIYNPHKRKHSSTGSDSSLSPVTPTAPLHLQYRSHTHPSAKSTSPYPTAAGQRRIASTPNARRPWTPDEEKALMDGLERVKGPHWSQILALYGNGGSISDILKDRNQVQLKDKARNLKLFFLKSGMDVPYFLQKVTGELKTRAPAQAAKLEAREKMKRMEEQKAATRTS